MRAEGRRSGGIAAPDANTTTAARAKTSVLFQRQKRASEASASQTAKTAKREPITKAGAPGEDRSPGSREPSALLPLVAGLPPTNYSTVVQRRSLLTAPPPCYFDVGKPCIESSTAEEVWRGSVRAGAFVGGALVGSSQEGCFRARARERPRLGSVGSFCVCPLPLLAPGTEPLLRCRLLDPVTSEGSPFPSPSHSARHHSFRKKSLRSC